MNEPDNNSNDIPEPVTSPAKRRPSLSMVWIVPLVAAILALWLTYRHYEDLGPLVTIAFETAEGIEAGRTPIRRLNVEIGRVEKVELAKSLDQVVVTARMIEDADDYLNEQTRFWVVRPRIGLSGVTGLDTLLSGSYIEMDSRLGGDNTTRFEGLEEPPLTPEGAPGMRLNLRAKNGGNLAAGSPVLHRGVKVGRIENRELSKDSGYVQVEIFIDAPYDRFINSNTRFWDAGGFDVSFGSDGIEVGSATLETILFGGVAFSNPPRLTESTPVEPGTVFPLYESEQDAETMPAQGQMQEYGFVLHFEESVRGLKIGAPVEFLGVRVGRVEDISIEYNPLSQDIEVPVLVFLEPQRISGVTGDLSVEASMSEAVGKGLRARLQTSSLLTGQLIVELAILPDEAPATYAMMEPYPILPTVPSQFARITSQAESFLDKLDALPLKKLVTTATQLLADVDALFASPSEGKFDEAAAKRLQDAPLQKLAAATTDTMDSIHDIVSGPDAKRIPSEIVRSLQQLNRTLRSMRNVLEGDAVESPFYYEMSTALKEVTSAARAVRELTETLEETPNAMIFGK